MIKVVIISELTGGGVEKVNTTLASYIDKDKYNVTVLSMISNKKDYDISKLKFKTIFLEGKSKKYVMKDLIQQFKVLKPDIILTNGLIETYVGLIYKRFYSKEVNIVYALHSVFSKMDKSTLKKKFLCNVLPKIIGVYNKIDAMIFVSNGVKYDFEKECCRIKVINEVIYNPIVDEEENFFRYNNINKKSINLVTAGRIEEEKNQQLIVNVVSKLVSKGYNIKLNVLGDGKLKNYLFELSKKMGIASCVNFMGFKENILHEFMKFDIFILSSNYESFGNVIVEAMNVGLPIISTDCPCGPREILKDGEYGTLVKINDPDEMYNAIIEIINNNNRERIFKAYNRSLDFSIQKSITGYENLFTRLKEK